MVLVAVLVCALNIIFHVILDFARDVPASADTGKSLAVRLLKILDLLLIAITFQIIAVSLNRLFIRPLTVGESLFLSALDIASFHDLKITVIQVSVVIMVILFLEHLVDHGSSLETLHMGLAVGVMILASVFAEHEGTGAGGWTIMMAASRATIRVNARKPQSCCIPRGSAFGMAGVMTARSGVFSTKLVANKSLAFTRGCGSHAAV